MKKKLFFMNNDKGFILPHVLFIITILLLYIFSNIYLYQNEIDLTYFYLDQLKIETLFQRGYTEFKADFPSVDQLENQQVIQYEYPDGQVKIRFTEEDSEKAYLYFDIKTTSDVSFSIVKPLILSESTL